MAFNDIFIKDSNSNRILDNDDCPIIKPEYPRIQTKKIIYNGEEIQIGFIDTTKDWMPDISWMFDESPFE